MDTAHEPAHESQQFSVHDSSSYTSISNNQPRTILCENHPSLNLKSDTTPNSDLTCHPSPIDPAENSLSIHPTAKPPLVQPTTHSPLTSTDNNSLINSTIITSSLQNCKEKWKSITQILGTFKTEVCFHTMLSTARSVMMNLRFLNLSKAVPLMMLGIPYGENDPEAFTKFELDYKSRILFTYRYSFEALKSNEESTTESQSPSKDLDSTSQRSLIPNSISSWNWNPISSLQDQATHKPIVSDIGWGCMVRVVQMGLAQILVQYRLGRNWRIQTLLSDQCNATHDTSLRTELTSILKLFMDAPQSPFSLHKIVYRGELLVGKKLKDWFGPTTGAIILSSLINEYTDQIFGIRSIVFQDGALYRNEVIELFQESSVDKSKETFNTTHGTIIWISLRLGVETFNFEKYQTSVQACFSFPQFQGLAGGNPSTSAYYFVAANSKELFYLDPHVNCQEAFTTVDDFQDLHQFFPSRIHHMPWSFLNPSMSLLFFCKDYCDFTNLCEKLDEFCSPILDIFDDRPKYSYTLESVTEDQVNSDLIFL